MSKRKVEDPLESPSKRSAPQTSYKGFFEPKIFDEQTIASHKHAYATSQPYKHDVVQGLISDELLRNVRQEITDSISFTPKETDIYKIHQSGDLANLDGLDAASLEQLPSLVKLRDALYSQDFRGWLEQVVEGCGKLSGTRTDMAVNVYTPGCHLLCHDDVIGTRRVSYILYLTDPAKPWKAEWGGALRLYPTTAVDVPKVSATGARTKDVPKRQVKTPSHAWTKVIPPAWNQLSFFAVQPGESFHDVEEVYMPLLGEPPSDDGGRIRMAISGWFHIPQEGEDGFEPGLEEKLAQQSSLTQLRGKESDMLDQPQPKWKAHPETIAHDVEQDQELTQDDLDFLVQYLNPRYLVPDTVEELAEAFKEDSVLRLGLFLAPKFADKLREEIAASEANSSALRPAQESAAWKAACPPHKQRFLFRQNGMPRDNETPTLDQLLSKVIPSLPFRKWLALATDLKLDDVNTMARRFRRGLDYTLAKNYDDDDPQLEAVLGLTPTSGWGDDQANGSKEDQGDDSMDAQNNGSLDDVQDDGEDAGQDETEKRVDPTGMSKGKEKSSAALHNGQEAARATRPMAPALEPEGGVGGYELLMVDDEDDEDEDDKDGSDHGVEIPADAQKKVIPASATGAGKRRERRDPAIYKAADDDNDGIIMSVPADWNTFTVVLRDRGIMKFVKYVSRSAQGDRWDLTAEWKVVDDADTTESEPED